MNAYVYTLWNLYNTVYLSIFRYYNQIVTVQNVSVYLLPKDLKKA